MSQMIINDGKKGLSIEHVFDTITTSMLDNIAGEINLTGTIEGIVEGEKCSQQYCVTYKNGTRVRFRVGTFIKGR